MVGALEEKAVSISIVTVSNLVPGLVQCVEYARMVFRTGHPTASEEEIERLAQLRVSRYEALIRKSDPFVTVVFPISALRGLPEHVQVSQIKTLLRHIERGRLAVHLIPDETPILAVAAPIQVYRLMDGTKVAASDHANGNHVYETAGETDKIEGIVTHVIGRCFPVDHTAMSGTLGTATPRPCTSRLRSGRCCWPRRPRASGDPLTPSDIVGPASLPLVGGSRRVRLSTGEHGCCETDVREQGVPSASYGESRAPAPSCRVADSVRGRPTGEPVVWCSHGRYRPLRTQKAVTTDDPSSVERCGAGRGRAHRDGGGQPLLSP